MGKSEVRCWTKLSLLSLLSTISPWEGHVLLRETWQTFTHVTQACYTTAEQFAKQGLPNFHIQSLGEVKCNPDIFTTFTVVNN